MYSLRTVATHVVVSKVQNEGALALLGLLAALLLAIISLIGITT